MHRDMCLVRSAIRKVLRDNVQAGAAKIAASVFIVRFFTGLLCCQNQELYLIYKYRKISEVHTMLCGSLIKIKN